MKPLSVYLLGREVATLAHADDFKSVLTYRPQAAANLVSLTMPVRAESYVWDDPLPLVLQMNLPEGYSHHDSRTSVSGLTQKRPASL
jgi:serine/threonine-protein kinase HipA